MTAPRSIRASPSQIVEAEHEGTHVHPLIKTFNDTFEILPADTPRLLNECYRIRYQVLCCESKIPGFRAEDYPDGLESDEFDLRSVHMLLRHRPTGRTIGTVRLVMSTDANSPFPLESCPAEAFHPGMREIIDQNRTWTTEISRLFLLPEFRARHSDTSLWGAAPDSRWKVHDRRRIPPIIGLFKAILMVTVHYEIRCWCAIMEPRLANLLAGYGIVMHPLGNTISYHGRRCIYFASVIDVLDQIHGHAPEIWELLTDDGRIMPRSRSDSVPTQRLTARHQRLKC